MTKMSLFGENNRNLTHLCNEPEYPSCAEALEPDNSCAYFYCLSPEDSLEFGLTAFYFALMLIATLASAKYISYKAAYRRLSYLWPHMNENQKKEITIFSVVLGYLLSAAITKNLWTLDILKPLIPSIFAERCVPNDVATSVCIQSSYKTAEALLLLIIYLSLAVVLSAHLSSIILKFSDTLLPVNASEREEGAALANFTWVFNDRRAEIINDEVTTVTSRLQLVSQRILNRIWTTRDNANRNINHLPNHEAVNNNIIEDGIELQPMPRQ